MSGSVDELTEFALHHLVARSDGLRSLPRDLVAFRPDCAPLELVLALSLAASSLESSFSGEADQAAAAEAWRLAALLAVDLHMMQHLNLRHVCAADYLAYWRGHDPYFLG